MFHGTGQVRMFCQEAPSGKCKVENPHFLAFQLANCVQQCVGCRPHCKAYICEKGCFCWHGMHRCSMHSRAGSTIHIYWDAATARIQPLVLIWPHSYEAIICVPRAGLCFVETGMHRCCVHPGAGGPIVVYWDTWLHGHSCCLPM